jgi:3-hydroxyisobutyrate dehydrogenase-like beta-hydroxyacid dehydrogenase
MSNRIGIIGIGLLGSALTERLLAADFEVIGFDPDDSRLSRFLDLGGKARSSAAEVAVDATRILLSLPNSEVVESVVGEIAESLRGGSWVIDTTTGAPDKTELIARRLLARGVGYLDATVAGSSEQARRGDIVMMVGGDPEDYAACADVFDVLARQTFHVGPSGCGSRMKLVVNLVLGLNRAALAEGLTLARVSGIDLATALDVLRSGAAYSAAMDTKGRKMIDEDFTPQARLAQHHKDVGLILDLAGACGIELPLSQLHNEVLGLAERLGLGELDNSAIIKAFGQSNPRRPADAP